eukprot:7441192-Pyramimonas_sp.AAC.1
MACVVRMMGLSCPLCFPLMKGCAGSSMPERGGTWELLQGTHATCTSGMPVPQTRQCWWLA